MFLLQGSEKLGTSYYFLQVFYFLTGLIFIICLFQEVYVYIDDIYYLFVSRSICLYWWYLLN